VPKGAAAAGHRRARRGAGEARRREGKLLAVERRREGSCRARIRAMPNGGNGDGERGGGVPGPRGELGEGRMGLESSMVSSGKVRVALNSRAAKVLEPGRDGASTTRRSDREAAGRNGEDSGGFMEGRRRLRSCREDSGEVRRLDLTAAEAAGSGHVTGVVVYGEGEDGRGGRGVQSEGGDETKLIDMI
jgi:hypothetical protein